MKTVTREEGRRLWGQTQFPLSPCTSAPLPTKQGLCLSRQGAAGSGLLFFPHPLKRRVCAFIKVCLLAWTIQFVDFSQGPVVGTRC